MKGMPGCQVGRRIIRPAKSGRVRMNRVRFLIPMALGSPKPTGRPAPLGLVSGAAMSVQDYAPAARCLLVRFHDLRRDACRLGEFRQRAIGQGTKVDGPPVHRVRDRQHLRQIRRLPRDLTRLMRHDEIKAICGAIASNWHCGLTSKGGRPAADGLIMVSAPPKGEDGWARRRIPVSGSCTTSARSSLQPRPAVLFMSSSGNDLLSEAAKRKAAAP
jgi:hypothetical protein